MIGDADCQPSRNRLKKTGELSNCYAAVCCCTSTYFQEVHRRDTRTATLTRLWSRVLCCCYYRCYTFCFCCAAAGYNDESATNTAQPVVRAPTFFFSENRTYTSNNSVDVRSRWFVQCASSTVYRKWAAAASAAAAALLLVGPTLLRKLYCI